MESVKKFIKSHVPLCAGTLGFAILGYMGYRAVRWIIKKCQKEQKVEEVVKEVLKSQVVPPKSVSIHEPSVDTPSSDAEPELPLPPTEPKPPVPVEPKKDFPSVDSGAMLAAPKLPVSPVTKTNRTMESVRVIEGTISKGQGEYIAYRIDENGVSQSPSPEEFEKIFAILNAWSPVAIMAREGEKGEALCASRDQIIREKIKEVAPDLQVAFIPRTLYELIFIRKCIREDVKRGKICPGLNYIKKRDKIAEELEGQKCWHLCHYKDSGNLDDPRLLSAAHRLNKAILRSLPPNEGGFTFEAFTELAKKELQYLKFHHASTDAPSHCQWPGPTTNFNAENTRGTIRPMGIKDDVAEKMVLNALTLDCSEFAQDSFILYRGGRFRRDHVIASAKNVTQGMHTHSKQEDEFVYSLSYGSSLFAGCVYDGEASAFYFMRNEPDAYAIVVPFRDLADSPFYIPPSNTLAQLYGEGEVFHARTKVSRDVDLNAAIPGVAVKKKRQGHLGSEMSREELEAAFNRYKSEAISIK